LSYEHYTCKLVHVCGSYVLSCPRTIFYLCRQIRRCLQTVENRAAEPQFCYGIVSFPIIQEGKGGVLYGIVYEMSGICPVSHPGSNMHVYRKVEDKWEYFCIVNVSM